MSYSDCAEMFFRVLSKRTGRVPTFSTENPRSVVAQAQKCSSPVTGKIVTGELKTTLKECHFVSRVTVTSPSAARGRMRVISFTS